MKLIFLGYFCIVLILNSVNTLKNQDGKDVASVQYHVWFEPNMSGNKAFLKQIVNVEHGSTFFKVMEKSDDNDFNYKFEYIEYPFGKYITSIGGKSEDPSKNIYWLLYKLDSEPNTENPPTSEKLTPYGVDGTLVSNGEIYLFWRTENVHK